MAGARDEQNEAKIEVRRGLERSLFGNKCLRNAKEFVHLSFDDRHVGFRCRKRLCYPGQANALVWLGGTVKRHLLSVLLDDLAVVLHLVETESC
jgi:hypothetical protein